MPEFLWFGQMPISPYPKCSLRIVEQKVNRRGFLKLGLMASVMTLCPGRAFGLIQPFLSPERSVSFYNTHTGERLKTVYWAQGNYLPEALADINHILRDHHTGETKPIDTHLLDLLYAIHTKLQARHPFYVVSGYRCPATNAFLRRLHKGVAKNSLHMWGKAVDIRLPSSRLSLLRRAAIDLKLGGVGYYPRSKFVHVDVGRVRYW